MGHKVQSTRASTYNKDSLTSVYGLIRVSVRMSMKNSSFEFFHPGESGLVGNGEMSVSNDDVVVLFSGFLLRVHVNHSDGELLVSVLTRIELAGQSDLLDQVIQPDVPQQIKVVSISLEVLMKLLS